MGEGCRRAIAGWGLKLLCKDPRWNSDSLSVIETPAGVDSGDVVKYAYAKYNLSLGVGLSEVGGLRAGLLACPTIALCSWHLYRGSLATAVQMQEVCEMRCKYVNMSCLHRCAPMLSFENSLPASAAQVQGKVFRIGHLGNMDELMLSTALVGAEMAMIDAGIDIQPGSGVKEAIKFWQQTTPIIRKRELQ